MSTAERKQSLGFDWHPNCLRCEECGKRLNPGQHAEHKGVPFCHHPCYGALFGPQLFGHGTRNECHTSFGKIENRDGQIKRSHLESRLKIYNNIYEGKPGELKSREANGRLVLEGVLRIYWGVKHIIHLKEEDDSRMIATRRQISMPSRLNVPCFSDSDDDVENTLWRDESPNRMDDLDPSNCNSRSQIDNMDESIGELDVNDVWSLQYETLKHNEQLSASSFSDNTYDAATHTSNNACSHNPCNDVLEPLLSNSASNLKESEANSELENDHSSEFQTAGLSCNSEYLTPLCESFDDHNQNTEAHETSELPLDYSDDLDTLSSTLSDQLGTLTFSINLHSHNGFLNCDNYAESNPLLDSSSVEYSLPGDTKGPHTPSCDSSPYSDSSDPLTSLTDTSEPQTPCDNPESKITYCLNQSSSLKLIKNNMNHIKRQTSLDNVANTMPLLSKECNNDELMKPSISYQSPKLSYHSVDSHLNGRTYKNGSTAIRRRPGRRMNKSRLKRRCSINGHFYLRETSSFTPPYGSPCSIWITSKTTAEEVLNMLLEKYKVEMSTYNFALFVVKDSGELRRIREDESPLVTRVMLGPHEDVAKVFIMDAQRTQEVSHEVAQFLNLSLAECRAILTKYEQEEMNQVKAIRKRYDDMRFYIQKRMIELRSL